MRRRQFVVSIGAVGSSVFLAGCGGGGGNVDGEIVVDETITSSDIQRFNFEVEQGQTINIYINNIEGARTTVVLTNTEDEAIDEYEADTEDTFSHEASQTGTYAVNITTLGEAEVELGLE